MCVCVCVCGSTYVVCPTSRRFEKEGVDRATLGRRESNCSAPVPDSTRRKVKPERGEFKIKIIDYFIIIAPEFVIVFGGSVGSVDLKHQGELQDFHFAELPSNDCRAITEQQSPLQRSAANCCFSGV